MKRWVSALKPDNAQGEYYITDIVAIAVADGIPVVAELVADERDVRGINDRAQLARASSASCRSGARRSSCGRASRCAIRRASTSAAT